jgi:chromosome partitioning protein
MQVISIAFSKGGSGKTTTARELAYFLSQDSRVLAIDLDPLAALTRGMGLEPDFAHSFAPVARRAQPAKLADVLIHKSDSLAVVTGCRELSITDTELKNQPSGAFALKRSLETVRHLFDFAIVDTQGAASKFVENAIVAANILLIPFRPQGEDLLVIDEFIELLEDVLSIRPNQIGQIAFLPIGYQAHVNQHIQAIEGIKHYRYPVLSPIKNTTKLAEAATQGVPLAQWDRDNERIAEYAAIGKLIKGWVKT